MIKQKMTLWGLALASGLLLSSCYETKQEFTLNPNGSGKVKHECSFQNTNLTQDNDHGEGELQDAAGKVIEGAKGVDVWRDVSFKRLADGRIWFQGTAYFKNLSDLEIKNQGMFSFAWKKTGVGKAELDLGFNKSDKQDVPAKPENLTPEQKSEKLKSDRAKFQQSKPMMASFLASMKQSVTFHLPGKIDASSNFKKNANGTLGLVFEGSKLLEVMEKLVNNDEWIAKNDFNSKGSPELDNEMSGLLFGEKAPVMAKLSGAMAPLFDYAAEVAAAQKEFAKLQKKLGVMSIAPPAQGAGLKNIKVVGSRLVSAVDKKLDVRPFNWNEGYTLSILAELPGSVISVTDKSSITKAVSIEGVDLIKGTQEWDRRLGFPNLSADKASVIFDVELKYPNAGTTGIKELSGSLQYNVANGSKVLDLGFASLKVGVKGTELGAEIKSIKEGWSKDGSQELELQIKLKPDDVKSASLSVDGTKAELDRNGYSSSGSTTTFTFKSKSAFPENGKIFIEIHDKMQTFVVPFKLENLSLLGTPLKP